MDFALLMNKPYSQGDEIIPTLPPEAEIKALEFPCRFELLFASSAFTSLVEARHDVGAFLRLVDRLGT